MPDSIADRNLLFGILALQIDFIGGDALIAAMQAWVLDKAKPLGQILVEQGSLPPDARDLLEALVRKHLEIHGGDPERSLASASSIGSGREVIQTIADPDVQASLARISAAHPYRPDGGSTGPDLYPTRPPSVGAPTAAGLRFRIIRPHAKGGLGEVFVAQDDELNREVALKEIQGRYADHPESRARFLLEAEVTGGLEHPGIVPVYGLGSYPDGRPYYAMRFIRGDSLKQAIRNFHDADNAGGWDRGRRTLELRQLLGRFVDACNAVAYAHSRGVLHRDLKPGNIMLGPYGETLVVDWGLAKPLGRPEGTGSLDQEPLRPASADRSTLTQMGSALGTPAFMSPEQAAGRLDLLGAASDVYSLGATLYCLLTGKAPFEGKDACEVLRRVQEGKPTPPHRVKWGVPSTLSSVCRKAMARTPEKRYASAADLATDVERWLADEAVSAHREPLWAQAMRWCRHHPGFAAFAGLAGVCDLLLLSSFFGVTVLVATYGLFRLLLTFAWSVQASAVMGLVAGAIFGAAHGLARGTIWKSVKGGGRNGASLGATLGAFIMPLLLFLNAMGDRGTYSGGIPVQAAGYLILFLGPAVGVLLSVTTSPPQSPLATRVMNGGIAGGIVGSVTLAILLGVWGLIMSRLVSR
jgi:serine/threonine-protein kinase